MRTAQRRGEGSREWRTDARDYDVMLKEEICFYGRTLKGYFVKAVPPAARTHDTSDFSHQPVESQYVDANRAPFCICMSRNRLFVFFEATLCDPDTRPSMISSLITTIWCSMITVTSHLLLRRVIADDTFTVAVRC